MCLCLCVCVCVTLRRMYQTNGKHPKRHLSAAVSTAQRKYNSKRDLPQQSITAILSEEKEKQSTVFVREDLRAWFEFDIVRMTLIFERFQSAMLSSVEHPPPPPPPPPLSLSLSFKFDLLHNTEGKENRQKNKRERTRKALYKTRTDRKTKGNARAKQPVQDTTC